MLKCSQTKQKGSLLYFSSFQIPQVIFALFLGPWSDRAGRKMLIMLPYFGYFLVCVSMIANVYFFDEVAIDLIVVESVPTQLIFCYLSDINILACTEY